AASVSLMREEAIGGDPCGKMALMESYQNLTRVVDYCENNYIQVHFILRIQFL
uniref:Uncharacterized protein n=1 Tax=Panthera leo TaxID=9689 RepID=A0A8C8XHN5_PANLE